MKGKHFVAVFSTKWMLTTNSGLTTGFTLLCAQGNVMPAAYVGSSSCRDGRPTQLTEPSSTLTSVPYRTHQKHP